MAGQEPRALRRERVFCDRMQPLDRYNDTEMMKRYRFSRRGCMFLIDLLQPLLEHPTRRSRAIPAVLQVFVALAFYATGGLLTSVATMHGLLIATVSRIVRNVSKALADKRNQYIKFPRSNHDTAIMKERFFEIAGFPKVLGAVDGTRVSLHASKLGDDEFTYVNRRGSHSVNVQLISGPDCEILNVVARWPGATHDSRILQMSRIARGFEQGHLHGLLIGDSGYPLLRWLMTPITNPTTPVQRAYNNAHVKTRVKVEMLNGQLKNKFRCLIGQGLSMEPERACDVIVACCVLFNISKELKEQQEPPENIGGDDDDHQVNAQPNNLDGLLVRSDIIDNFFV